MDTKTWGKCAWKTFFIFSRNYPEQIDLSKKQDKLIYKSTYEFYSSLRYILPCKYCRESYNIFWKEIPIKKYLDSRDNLTFWLYKIKDMVNQKLIYQEQQLYQKLLSELIKEDRCTPANIARLKRQILKTKPSPAFRTVIDYYEKFRR